MSSPDRDAGQGSASSTDNPSSPDGAAAEAGVGQGAALAEAAADVVSHGVRAALAWLRLAQSEAGLARAHLWRIAIAGAVALLGVFFTWLSAAVALGAALMATGMPVALALALVFLAHVLVLFVLALLMRRWSRSLGFPRSRAAFMSMFSGDKS